MKRNTDRITSNHNESHVSFLKAHFPLWTLGGTVTSLVTEELNCRNTTALFVWSLGYNGPCDWTTLLLYSRNDETHLGSHRDVFCPTQLSRPISCPSESSAAHVRPTLAQTPRLAAHLYNTTHIMCLVSVVPSSSGGNASVPCRAAGATKVKSQNVKHT